MGVKTAFREWLFKAVDCNDRRRHAYLKFARFLSTRGICPPLSLSRNNSLKRWENYGTSNGAVFTDNYQTYDRSLDELFRDVIPYLNARSPILEVGCNSGRSLDYLRLKGFTRLSGIEISCQAIETMKQTFAKTYDISSIEVGNAPDILKRHETGKFELVFCHSVLVNIHPRYNSIFSEMARVSSKFILILENEGSFGLYPRDFVKLFEDRGFTMISMRLYRRMCTELAVPFCSDDRFSNNTIRLFVKNALRT